jgi:hypothetical protein
MKTSPKYYARMLSVESAEDRIMFEKELESLYEKLDSAKGIESIKLSERVSIIEKCLEWQGADPRILKKQELRQVITSPTYSSQTEDASRKRIKNPKTAIRAYCLWCMGGESISVKNCESLNCPLWSFREGNDPFRGYDIPKLLDTDLMNEEDEELDSLFEEEEDTDDSE